MKKIYLLIDYKGIFGSKYLANPYRSGMDKVLLKKYFNERSFEPIFINFRDINFRINDYVNQIILYSSSEDINGFYKDYIEDILYGLLLQGAVLIPDFKFFRAHNNKVFMEILRDLTLNKDIKNEILSYHFGTLEDLETSDIDKSQQFVIKSAAGAVSQGVSLSDDYNSLRKFVKKISKTKSYYYEIWDVIRSIKRNGYIKESKNRKKFILQNFIPNLNNDWKVLIFGDKYFVLHRKVRKNDFRASGSGLISYNRELPDGFLDYCRKIFEILNIPNIGIDIAFDGKEFHILEFQAVYFGTHTLDTSPYYYQNRNNIWTLMEDKSILEKEYVNSIANFLNNKGV